ncbi:nitrile hydratase accessory protein [Pseudohalocynthiibacter aestuariivivens]|nr:nitrile hydratase accessory protein [Pseudohalocynthiibacter aestuariivivens]QIE44265.1 nitrile hydratase accessory protein [Pseudohalocynthiibacter aestuariivivens]
MTPLETHKQTMDDVAAVIPDLCGDGPLFRAPWQARIFALIVGCVHAGHVPWATFQARLAREITEMEKAAPSGAAQSVENEYFECWLQAAEATLQAEGVIAEGDIAAQIADLRVAIAAIRTAQSTPAGFSTSRPRAARSE